MKILRFAVVAVIIAVALSPIIVPQQAQAVTTHRVVIYAGPVLSPIVASTYSSQPDGTVGVDTGLVSATTTTNYGADTTFTVGEWNGGASVTRGLLKFDLSSIPSTAQINSATLSLWQSSDLSSNARTLRVYRSKRAWVESEATWNIYSTGNNWQAAGGFGANDAEQTDIGSRAFSATEANGEKQWTLTASAIQEMVAGAFANNGFVLKADTETNDMYQFQSSDWTTASERPKLVIEYAEYVSQPDGTAGVDTTIRDDTPTTNYGTATTLNIGEANSTAQVGRALLKFDLSSIPANATINSATLSLWQTADISSNARAFRVYRSLRAWVENQATWNIYSTGNNWQTAGGFGANDAEQTDIGSRAFTASEANGEKQWSLTASAIQEMVAGAFANNGFVVRADTETDDMYQFRSSDWTTAGERPKLVVEFNIPTNTPTPTNTATATNTATFTATSTPTDTATNTATPTNTPTATATNVDNGAGVDTYIMSDAVDSNFGTAYELHVGEDNAGASTRRTLVKFDLSGIPTNATVTSATMHLHLAEERSDNATTVHAYRVLRLWEELEATWHLAWASSAWFTDGLGLTPSADYNGTSLGNVALSNAEATGDKTISLTVATVQDMVSGAVANYGFFLRAETESDNLYIFRSSEWTTASERPELIVEYTVPTDTPGPTATFTNTATDTPTATATDTPGATPTFTNTPTDTATPTATFTPSITPTPSATATPGGYTYILSSGQTFIIDPEITFGEMVQGGMLTALLLVFLVYVIYRVIERWA